MRSQKQKYQFDCAKDSFDDLKFATSKRVGTIYYTKSEGAGNAIVEDFILSKTSESEYVVTVKLPMDVESNLFRPKLTFKRKFLKDTGVGIKKVFNDGKLTFSLEEGGNDNGFWRLIAFLATIPQVEFKEVRIGPLANSQNEKIVALGNQSEVNAVEKILALVREFELTEVDFKPIYFDLHKKHVEHFFCLLKNEPTESHGNFRDAYWHKFEHEIQNHGEEYIWHHFLKKRDWILGLHVNKTFAIDILSEKLIGNADSEGKGSPRVDFLGVNDYMMVIELKHSSTKIFSSNKTTSSRANTWDFSAEFFEAISQCVGQKAELEAQWKKGKKIQGNDGNYLEDKKVAVEDPQVILIIGNKKVEFPSTDYNLSTKTKKEAFERFRRNLRNIDIVTYDELFERAYFAVHSERLPDDWYHKLKREDLQSISLKPATNATQSD